MIEILDYKDKSWRRVIKDCWLVCFIFSKPIIIRIVIIYDKNFHYLCSFYKILGMYIDSAK